MKYLFLLAVSINTLLASNLEDYLNKTIQEKNLPGISAAISINGRIIDQGVAGVRKITSSEPVQLTDKFHLGSCTKAMTATVAATFVEDGKLKWDDSLEQLLPDIEIHPDLKKITFEMLLAHRSGLIPNPERELKTKLMKLNVAKARKILTKEILQSSPAAAPGKFSYSNVGYIIAGHILEMISGRSWEMLMQERLFSKLEMKSCGFGSPSNAEEIFQPWGHYISEENGAIYPTIGDNPSYVGPAGTVHCSLEDWNKFLIIHMEGFNGKDSLIKAETFKKLHTAYAAKDVQYTYGAWSVLLNQKWAKGVVLVHNGSNTVNYAYTAIAPQIGAVLMGATNIDYPTNEDGSSASVDGINNVLLQMIKLHL